MHILPLIHSLVLQCKGEAVHLLSMFQRCKVEDWSCAAALHIVVGGLVGRMVEPVPGRLGCFVFGLWW